MKTILRLTVALALAAIAFTAFREQREHSASENIDRSRKRSAAAEGAANLQRQAILAEIKGLTGHDWAGEYYAGDGLGVNTSLVIAPKSGYVFEWHGCLGLYDRNYGPVTSINGRLRLSFTFANQREGFQGIAPELVPVTWGPRSYLIPADDVVGFCNNINGGQEPRGGTHGLYFLRRGDEKAPVDGLPVVPKEFQEYLLAKPIEATIVAVGRSTTRPSVSDWNFKETPLTIDAGARQGLRVGMELFVTTPRNAALSLEITKVDETSSEAIMTQIGEEDPGPKASWRLSTQAPWNAQRAK